MKKAQWPAAKIDSTIKRGPHKSALKDSLFLRREFAAMMHKGQWTVIPAYLTRRLKGVRMSPVGIMSQRDRFPRTIMDYSFYDVNEDTATVAPNQAIAPHPACNTRSQPSIRTGVHVQD
jgi:hypothetical protein